MLVTRSSVVPDFVTPWTVAHQPPLSMEFFRQEYWNGLQFPSPGNLPHPGIKPQVSCFAGWFFTRAPRGFKIYFGKFLRKHTELLDFHKLSLPRKQQPDKKYNQHRDTISTDSLPLAALLWCSLTLLAWLFLLQGSAWLAVSSHSSLSKDITSESLPEVLNPSLPPWTCLNFPCSSYYHTLFVSIFPTCKNPRGQKHSNLAYGGSLEN